MKNAYSTLEVFTHYAYINLRLTYLFTAGKSTCNGGRRLAQLKAEVKH